LLLLQVCHSPRFPFPNLKCSVSHQETQSGGLCLTPGLMTFYSQATQKCDGIRPVCTRCAALGHPEDCEYDDPRHRSENQHLEASIASLEARILKLGGTLPTSPEVNLHEPHTEGLSPGSSFSAWSTRNRNRSPQHTSGMQVTLPDKWWQTPLPPLKVTKIL
jgi:hypothetical protein